jgi:hypothetical protein
MTARGEGSFVFGTWSEVHPHEALIEIPEIAMLRSFVNG